MVGNLKSYQEEYYFLFQIAFESHVSRDLLLLFS